MPSRTSRSNASARGRLPEGFELTEDFLDVSEEAALITFASTVRYGVVRMHGVEAKRRVAQFGWRYSFESYSLTPAQPVPDALLGLRERVSGKAGIAPADFSEVLVTEYPAGAGIGWHRDAPHFGVVAGVSLGAGCRMRFRRGEAGKREMAAVELPARSLYLLTGSARQGWQHTIPPVKEVRWSITFRTLREAGNRQSADGRAGARLCWQAEAPSMPHSFPATEDLHEW
jgi:DNA oxidative demethylase